MAIKRIQVRRDTGSEWEDANPILADGELGFDTTLRNIKVGDGVKPWNDLGFIAPTKYEVMLQDGLYLEGHWLASWENLNQADLTYTNVLPVNNTSIILAQLKMVEAKANFTVGNLPVSVGDRFIVEKGEDTMTEYGGAWFFGKDSSQDEAGFFWNGLAIMDLDGDEYIINDNEADAAKWRLIGVVVYY